MRTQINPTIKGHLVRVVFYLLFLLAVCVIPSVLGQQEMGYPRPQLPRHRQATISITAQGGLPMDESVTWQNNRVHDGFNPASPLVPPLRLKWSHDFS